VKEKDEDEEEEPYREKQGFHIQLGERERSGIGSWRMRLMRDEYNNITAQWKVPLHDKGKGYLL